MKKKIKLVSGIIILFLLQTCCAGKFQCPGLSSDDLSYLNFNINDSLKFVNSNGSTINFVVKEKNISSPYENDCQGSGGCNCSCGDCKTSGNIKAISDSSRGGINILIISLNSDFSHSSGKASSETKELDYTVFDLIGRSGSSSIHNYTQYNVDSLLPNISFGSKAYSNVSLVKLDTTNSINQNKFISKIYFNKQFGVIGFYDRQTQSLFYRQ